MIRYTFSVNKILLWYFKITHHRKFYLGKALPAKQLMRKVNNVLSAKPCTESLVSTSPAICRKSMSLRIEATLLLGQHRENNESTYLSAR